MDNKFYKHIKLEHIFLLFTLIMCYLIWSETKKLEKNFEEIDKEWNVLDQRIETYKVKIQEIDSINGELSKEIAKFDEYR
jgi:hypothetical protein